MKQEQIKQLFEQFENICYLYNDIVCWSARELQTILGYTKWENFLKVIDKAKNAAEGVEIKASDHFPDVRKMIDFGYSFQNDIKY